jgi:putative FmdB family regulatory protein
VPTYEYRCKACGHELEVVQSFTDDPLTRCEACGAEELRKVFGSVGIAFKGSGFYKNDSRGGSSKSGGDKSSTSDKGAGSDKSSTSDKPAKADKAGSTAASTPASTGSSTSSSTPAASSSS